MLDDFVLHIYYCDYCSLLDDNKILTLPNGERLALPGNVRILFEVESVKYATLATISRCGMILFGSDIVNCSMVLKHWVSKLKSEPLDELESPEAFSCQKECVESIEPFFVADPVENYILKGLFDPLC